jgi:outer membrane protein OmpA-like peptidoglycan-associated protein
VNAPYERNLFRAARVPRRVFRRKLQFEALEPRLLLSADGVTPTAADLVQTVDSDNLTTALVQESQASPTVIVEALRAQLRAAAWANQPIDSGFVELDTGDPDVRRIASLDGTIDALIGSSERDNEWRITGEDTVTLNGVEYSGVNVLLGGADNEDVFILEPDGSLSGYLEGGPGGFDTLVIEGGSFASATYTATGPQSGSVELDGNVIDYFGLEPITDNSNAVNRVLTTSASIDDITLSDGPSVGQLTLEADNGSFESHTFTSPRVSLRVNAGDADDTITLDALLGYSGALLIDGGAGDDTVDLSALIGDFTLIGRSDGSFTITDGIQTFRAINIELFTGPHAVLFEQGVPDWQEQGPGPITSGQLVMPPDNIVSGAIQSIAPHPFDPNLLFVGTANGGVWRNTDRTVFFEFSFATLTSTAQAILNEYATFLLQNPGITVAIGGHTDSVGDTGSNQTLSVNRANAVRDHLIAQGVPASQLTATGFGETQGIADNNTDAGRALNRRVELITNHWEPLTDQFPSLAIGSVAISPLDNAGNAVTAATTPDDLVIFAGTGRFSNFAQEGGQSIGLLRSLDGGATWSLLGVDELLGLSITAVVPTGLTTPDGQVVLVSALTKFDADRTTVLKLGGVFRSDDGGQTFQRVVDGSATDLVADPGDPDRFYAAVVGQGVLRSDDLLGLGWAQVNTNLDFLTDTIDNDQDGTADNAGEDATGAARIVLAVQPDPGSANNPVYAALIDANGRFMGAFRSTNQGGTWTALGPAQANPTAVPVAGITTQPQVNLGGQGAINFSMAVDVAGNVFIGGDADNGTGLAALWWRNNATGLWDTLFGANAGGTTPHADSRALAFDATGRLLESSDGGIVRLVNPRGLADPDSDGTAGPGRAWQSMNGNLRISEVLFAAYDPLGNVIFAGMQDNGSNEQVGGLGAWLDVDGDGLPDDAATRFAWTQVLGGDGNTQQAALHDLNSDGLDNDADGTPDDGDEFQVERFSLANNWQFFGPGPDGILGNADDIFFATFRAATFDAAGNPVGAVRDRALFAPAPGPDAVLGTFDDTPTGRPGSGLVDPADASFNGFTLIPYAVNAINPDRMIIGLFGLYESPNRLATINNLINSGLGAGAGLVVGTFFNALAYGGRDGVTPKPDVIYAARGSDVLVRETNTTGTAADFTTRNVPGAGELRDVVIDPDNWQTAYVIDGRKVYKTTDAGVNWDIISDELAATDLKSLEIVKTPGGDKVLLVGASLGVYRAINPVIDVQWTELGSGLPNALVRDIDFADRLGSLDDVLLAGTMGRGAWTLGGDADDRGHPPGVAAQALGGSRSALRGRPRDRPDAAP